MLTLCASFLLSCGFDAGSLPEVQTPDVVEPLPFDEGVEMPLHAVRLALAAEVGGLAMIDEFHQTSTELDWPDDGARAVKLAARYGQRDAPCDSCSPTACATCPRRLAPRLAAKPSQGNTRRSWHFSNRASLPNNAQWRSFPRLTNHPSTLELLIDPINKSELNTSAPRTALVSGLLCSNAPRMLRGTSSR